MPTLIVDSFAQIKAWRQPIAAVSTSVTIKKLTPLKSWPLLMYLGIHFQWEDIRFILQVLSFSSKCMKIVISNYNLIFFSIEPKDIQLRISDDSRFYDLNWKGVITCTLINTDMTESYIHLFKWVYTNSGKKVPHSNFNKLYIWVPEHFTSNYTCIFGNGDLEKSTVLKYYGKAITFYRILII